MFGRDYDSKSVVQLITSAFEDTTRWPMVRIEGTSGSGKSSLLRAGILPKLQDSQSPIFKTVVCKAADFRNGKGIPEKIVITLLNAVEEQTELGVSARHVKDIERDLERFAPAKAVSILSDLLEKSDNERAKYLVIALDQFEEVIDDFVTSSGIKQWQPLFNFLAESCQNGAIGFILTLESSRINLFKNSGIHEKIKKSEFISIEGFERTFLREIIEKTFQKTGYTLESEIIERLLKGADNLRRYESRTGQMNEGSLLPLFSLKLYSFFDEVDRFVREKIPDDIKAQSDPFGKGIPIKLTEFCEFLKSDHEIEAERNFFRITDEIDKLGNSAWKDATGKSYPDNESIGSFLHPLVRLTGFENKNPALNTTSIPTIDLLNKIAKSFLNHRLCVKVGSQHYRFIHEAVIRYWKPARKWFDSQIDFLIKKEQFRKDSHNWHRASNLTIENVDERTIDTAAEILTVYAVDWANPKIALLEDERILKEYCVKIFSLSETPEREVRSSPNQSVHIHLATGYGLIDLVKKFQNKNPKCITTSRKDGITPLHFAIWFEKLDLINFLLETGADPTCLNNHGVPLLAYAIWRKREDIFHLLLPHYGVENLKREDGFSVLHHCAEENQTTFAKQLISRYGLDFANDYRYHPIHSAAIHGQFEIFVYFTKLPNIDIGIGDSDGNNVLHHAATYGKLNIITHIIDNDLPKFHELENLTNRLGKTPLMLAAENHHPKCVELLLKVSDPNTLVCCDSLQAEQEDQKKLEQRGTTALHLAISNFMERNKRSITEKEKCYETIDLLMNDPRMDINIKNESGDAILWLARKDHKISKRILKCEKLNLRSTISRSDETPVNIAIDYHEWDYLLQSKIKVGIDHSNRYGEDQNTILHLLVKQDPPEAIIQETINDKNLDINALNKNDQSPLMLIIEQKNWKLAKLLLASGKVDLSTSGKNQYSELAMAIEGLADLDFLETLINCNINQLSYKADGGWTPLHMACIQSNQQLIELIGSKAENPKLLWQKKDRNDRTPNHFLTFNVNKTPNSWDSNLKWHKVENEIHSVYLERVLSKYDLTVIDENVPIFISNLPFYKQNTTQIICLGGIVPGYYLVHENDELVKLDGSSNPIHDINEKSGVVINDETILDYLRFFCFFLNSKETNFLVVEGLNQWEIAAEVDPSRLVHIKNKLRSAEITGFYEENHTYHVSATIWHGKELFWCEFEVTSEGEVNMLADLALAKDLPKLSTNLTPAEIYTNI